MNLSRYLKLPLAALTAVLAGALLIACSGGKDNSAATSASPGAGSEAFHATMRQLWEDHIAWTRLAIVSLGAGLPDTPATVDRLMRNQADIGDAIKPYYGGAAGDQLTSLLKEHIAVAAQLVQAAKAGDTAGVTDAKARWYANADEIAAFLSSANPASWRPDETRSMMRDHLDLTLREAVSYLTGDYKDSVAAYDAIHVQALHMADMLSDGITSQFSDRFAEHAAAHR